MNRPVTRHTKLAHAVDITAAVRIADNRRILHHYPVSSPVMRKRHARRASCHDRCQSHHRRYFSYIFPHADYLRFRNVHAKISSRFRAYIQIDFLFHNKYARKAAILSFFYKIQKNILQDTDTILFQVVTAADHAVSLTSTTVS